MAAVSATGLKIPLYCIFKTDPTEEMLDNDLDSRVKFAKSETGFSNAELTLDWLKHFNRQSFEESQTFKDLTFMNWFGCDEKGYNRNGRRLGSYAEGIGLRRHQEARNRILIIDGFSGHCTEEVKQYSEAFDIKILGLPPHGTHKMQPLDVGVFSSFKSHHQRALRQYVQGGSYSFTRAEFVRSLQVFCPSCTSGEQADHARSSSTAVSRPTIS